MTEPNSAAVDANLTGDDAMAHRFLRRAADAIVSASQLGKEVGALQASTQNLNDSLSVLQDIKRNQEERIASLESELTETKASLSGAVREATRFENLVSARQRDIDILDTKVEGLSSEISDMTEDRDRWKAKSELQAEALNDVVGKINAIHSVLGKSPLDPDPREEIEAASQPSPSSEGFEAPRTDENWTRDDNHQLGERFTPEYEYEDKPQQHPDYIGYDNSHPNTSGNISDD